MSRRLERLGIWLGATVGGAGLIYAAYTAASGTEPALLGVLWVLGAALLAVGVIGFATETVAFVNRALPDKPVVRSDRPVAAPTADPPVHKPAISPPPSPPMPMSADKGRQLVQVTPAYLLGLFSEHTSRDAKRLMADFLGKWIRVQGDVTDVNEIGDNLLVQMRQRLPDRGSLLIAMMFRGASMDRAATLRRGDKVDVIGRIASADRISLDLDQCELV